MVSGRIFVTVKRAIDVIFYRLHDVDVSAKSKGSYDVKTRENLLRGVDSVGWMKPRVKEATENFLTEIFLQRCLQKSSIFPEIVKKGKWFTKRPEIIANDFPCASPVCLFLLFAVESAAIIIKNTITLANDCICVQTKLSTA